MENMEKVTSAESMEKLAEKAGQHRADLLKLAGVKKVPESVSYGDFANVLAKRIRNSLAAESASAYNSALLLGMLSDAKIWVVAHDESGKSFKSETQYLKYMFPDYASSTVMLYADIGRTIYLPIKEGKAEMSGLERLAEVPPATLKATLKYVKTAEGREALKKGIAGVKNARITGKILSESLKDLSTSKDRAGAVSDSDEAQALKTAQELSGEAYKIKLSRLFLGVAKTKDSEAQFLVPEGKESELKALLMDAKNDTVKAAEIIDYIISFIK